MTRSDPELDPRSDAQAFTLVSHHLCPYVQRAAIALTEKGVMFERRYIDLANKPEWFRALSPLGKVPLLLARSGEGHAAVVFESAIICEYLEDAGAGPALHLSTPLERARHRGWIEFGSSILSTLWLFETAVQADAYETHRQALVEKFARVEAELGAGPFFAGERFCLVDAAFAPIFRYFDVFDELADTRVFIHTPRVRAWRSALAGRRSVREAVVSDYGERLRVFLRAHDAYVLKLAA